MLALYVGVQVSVSFAERFRSVWTACLVAHCQASSLYLRTGESFFAVRLVVLISFYQIRHLRTVRMKTMLVLFVSDSGGHMNISASLQKHTINMSHNVF